MSDATLEGADQLVTLPTGITLCYRDHGDPADPAILLVAGLGEDQTYWGDAFIHALIGRGHRVITMDNRDVGRSTYVATPPPAIWRQVLARPRRDAYSLADMAGDCVGVLDHLGIDRVHLVGRSMGGMIAQTIAATEPDRALSLTSIYSTTGAPKLGQPAASTIRILVLAPVAQTRDDFVRAHLRITRHIAGTAFAVDETAERSIAGGAWDRSAGDLAAGSARQIEAIQRSGDRTAQLRRITAPTLVIHGDRDRMVAPSGGAATAAAIPGAEHVVIPGMGHHLPDELAERVADLVARHVAQVSAGGQRP